jgi:glycyl-tRNA synthetase
MTMPLDFQSIILKLQDFWNDQGCLIWQPYYTQVGAGTMNPATFLRVLGPEPWNVAYVEPSVRPDDGRYGENPNRMQMHYQFQVILKPDPGDPQERYLRSLEALGIDPLRHDIRFVEDNWESPALGAWGLGWEVWLDGQEITQFTYFQQAGGVVLDPVSVELTYGLERIAISLQQVSSFREIRWNPALTDGDVNLQAEQEHSKYYFEVADVQRLRQMYDLFEAEARVCLDQGLILPAYDYILKCSHTFNVLDTRGAVGVTDRQAFFGRMRELSRRVTEAYLEQRQRLEFPWMEQPSALNLQKSNAGQQSVADRPRPAFTGRAAEALLVEIGTEELPANDLDVALEQLRLKAPEMLEELRLEHGKVYVYGTPRRLVLYVEDLAARQTDEEQVVKGPPAARAFGTGGAPTPAAEGFARSKGITVDDLQVREMDGGSYVIAILRQAGRPAAEVLSRSLPGLIASLRFEKSMRWNNSNVSFSRPIRWLLALLGRGETRQVVPFSYAGLQAGDSTHGLRFRTPEEFCVRSPEEYFTFLEGQGILLDVGRRQELIHDKIQKLAEEVGGAIPDDPDLLAEVANLVEAPYALRGSFDPSYLKLPRQVLVSVMKKHQRYFPVVSPARKPSTVIEKELLQDSEETLLPYFVAVRNGDELGADIVVEGNQHVIRARFADANFFVREDLKKPLEDYLPRLDTLMFQAKLGSMLDKTHRITALAGDLAQQIGLSEDEITIVLRAAGLCKADLATRMVVEMTSLQGQMGQYYALQSNERKEVAQAIFEHYLPRFAGDRMPGSLAGLTVGLADLLDSLVGLFAAGLAPSGNRDPFAQRRAALGLSQSLVAWELDFDLRPAMRAAAAQLPVPAGSESLQAVMEFILERQRNALLENGARYDVIDAVLVAQSHNPAHAARAVKQLEAWVLRPDWSRILPAYARCARITREYPRYEYLLSPETDPTEKDLYQALQVAENTPRAPGSVDDFLSSFTPMIPSINRFFDLVLVMVEDEQTRQNRLGLLQRIVALADGVADMSRLEGF